MSLLLDPIGGEDRRRIQVRAAAKKYRLKNLEKCREQSRISAAKRRAADPEKVKRYARDWNLRKRYGITLDQYQQIFADQKYRCAICGDSRPGGHGQWHTDHCHSTGRARGILCHCCNFMIGQAKDDPARLRAATEYLEKHAGP